MVGHVLMNMMGFSVYVQLGSQVNAARQILMTVNTDPASMVVHVLIK